MDSKNRLGVSIAVALAAALAACAATPPASPPPATAVTTQLPATAALPAQPERTFPGFERVVRNGVEYFCQTRTVTGSRARSAEICRTRDGMREMEEANEKFRREADVSASQSTMKLDSPQ